MSHFSFHGETLHRCIPSGGTDLIIHGIVLGRYNITRHRFLTLRGRSIFSPPQNSIPSSSSPISWKNRLSIAQYAPIIDLSLRIYKGQD